MPIGLALFAAKRQRLGVGSRTGNGAAQGHGGVGRLTETLGDNSGPKRQDWGSVDL